MQYAIEDGKVFALECEPARIPHGAAGLQGLQHACEP